MASANKDATLRAAFTDLVKAEVSGDYQRGLKVANRVLKQWPSNKDAFRCKIVSLIQLGKAGEALAAIKKAVPKQQELVAFERAYCEYRENRPEEALKILEGMGERLPEGGRELMAQLYYRLERFSEARPLFLRLLKESTDEWDSLRSVNLQAVEVNLLLKKEEGFKLSDISAVDGASESSDELYNGACALSAAGDMAGALKLLKRAEKTCQDAIAAEAEEAEEEEESELEEDLAIIRTQMAYVKQCLGDSAAAAKMYQDVLNGRKGDAVVNAVCGTNIVAAKSGEANLFDTRKKLKLSAGPLAEKKLGAAQRRVVAYNNALLLLLSNQAEPCRKALEAFKAEHEDTGLDALLLEIALLMKSKEPGKALELLKNWKGDNTSELQLVAIALHLMEGQTERAEKELKALEPRGIGPLSLRHSLRLQANDRPGAMAVLKDAIGSLKKSSSSASLVKVMEELSNLHLEAGETKEASRILEELRKAKPKDPGVLASLIHAYAQFDPAKAEELSESLASLDGEATTILGSDGKPIDVDALEANPELSARGYKRKAEATPKAGGGGEEEVKKKKKKKRKIRLPKEFDPSQPPDPERWLPKYERSTFRRRKDKRKADREIGRGAQGAVSGAAEALDMSNKPMSEKAASPTVQSPSLGQGPRQNRPGGQTKKKKPAKKGKGGW